MEPGTLDLGQYNYILYIIIVKKGSVGYIHIEFVLRVLLVNISVHDYDHIQQSKTCLQHRKLFLLDY